MEGGRDVGGGAPGGAAGGVSPHRHQAALLVTVHTSLSSSMTGVTTSSFLRLPLGLEHAFLDDSFLVQSESCSAAHDELKSEVYVNARNDSYIHKYNIMMVMNCHFSQLNNEVALVAP